MLVPRAYGTNTTERKTEKMPRVAGVLGTAGLIPFVGTVASSIYFPEAIDLIGELQALYGCCILSFLGGIHWGLALMKTGTEIGMFLLI